jgi:dienelactone hydrolase
MTNKHLNSIPISTRALPYADLDTTFTGVLHWNPVHTEPSPGILLIHGGAGLDEHARGQARRYAELGYVVLACDMFGDGIAGDRDRVMACILGLRDDPELLARRGLAGLTALASLPETSTFLAAIGFCFGGMAALALARSGAPLAAAVSIHGSLATSRPAEPDAVTARLLVCHGSADPHVPMGDVVAFAEEMNSSRADWQLTMYGQAAHGFTHRHAVPGAMPGVEYNQGADELSFAAVREFLAGTLAVGELQGLA